MNLFVYGTLLYPYIHELVCGRRFPSQKGELKGYEIFVVKGAEFPGIVKSQKGSAAVKGEILMNLSEEEMASIDRYEDNFYVRNSRSAFVESFSREIAVEVYEVPSELSHELLSKQVWTRQWFETNHYEKFIERVKGLERSGL